MIGEMVQMQHRGMEAPHIAEVWRWSVRRYVSGRTDAQIRGTEAAPTGEACPARSAWRTGSSFRFSVGNQQYDQHGGGLVTLVDIYDKL